MKQAQKTERRGGALVGQKPVRVGQYRLLSQGFGEKFGVPARLKTLALAFSAETPTYFKRAFMQPAITY